jgi:hypothetical protein
LKIKNGFLKKYKRTKDVFEQLKLVSCRRWWPCLTAAAAAAQWARRSLRGCRGFRGLRQGGRRLVGGERLGVGDRGTLGTSAPLSRSGSRRGPRGPGSRRENARGHRTSNTGTQGEGAASVGVVLRSSISLRPVAVVFGLGVGPVGGWSRAGAKSLAGTMEFPRSSSRGPLGWVGSCAGRVTAAGWGGWRAGIWASC